MFEAGNELVRLSDARISDDGNAVGFQIERADEQTFAAWCRVPTLNDAFHFLAVAAKAAGEQREEAPRLGSEPQNYTTPIPAIGIAFQAGQTPAETVLVMRLHGFDMGFQIPSDGLVRLADDIARIARTLSASQAKPN